MSDKFQEMDPVALLEECRRMHALINHPEIDEFFSGVRIEAAHQMERWGMPHDRGKTPLDWFWLVGFLSQKATHAAQEGDTQKALHHTISTSACLFNWYLHIKN